MKKIKYILLSALILLIPAACPVFAAEGDAVIKEGVFAGPVELSGMTEDEAENAVDSYIEGLNNAELILSCVSGNTVTVKVSEFGVSWGNRDIIPDAVSLGRSGNIIKRFKDLSDLKKHKKKYDLELAIDDEAVRKVIGESCTVYDTKPKNAELIPGDGGSFTIIEGEDGYAVNVESSVAAVEDYIHEELTEDGGPVELVVDTVKPRGDTETLSKIKDKLGSYTTKYETSGADRSANIATGCRHINGTLLYPGEQFSVYEHVSPFTEENGYHLAGSYLNGLVVESLGGGICQVSTTLYQAVLRAELQVDERSNHSMVVDYVPHGGDAAIAGTAKDFKFTNSTPYPIYIAGQTGGKAINFTIYGVETRDMSRRSLDFESVELSREEPGPDKVIGDSASPAGSVHTQSAHTGYRCEFWKIIKEDGNEVSREKISTSTYKAVPRIITIGTGTDNAVTKAALDNAIATQNPDYAKAVAASIGLDGGAGALAEQQMGAAAAAAAAGVTVDETAGAEEEQAVQQAAPQEEQHEEEQQQQEYRAEDEEEPDG
ncbi:MAG: VanW family protein [Lachnospiraceae bacterium]|nr:VanW family protein [Lachnospiraceae bacterium]